MMKKKTPKTNNPTPRRERKTADVRARIKAGITAWMKEADYNLLDSEIDDLVVQVETALARKEAK